MCFCAMVTHFQSRAWSSSTLLRGVSLLGKQDMELSGEALNGQVDEDLVAMERELAALEARTHVDFSVLCEVYG